MLTLHASNVSEQDFILKIVDFVNDGRSFKFFKIMEELLRI